MYCYNKFIGRCPLTASHLNKSRACVDLSGDAREQHHIRIRVERVWILTRCYWLGWPVYQTASANIDAMFLISLANIISIFATNSCNMATDTKPNRSHRKLVWRIISQTSFAWRGSGGIKGLVKVFYVCAPPGRRNKLLKPLVLQHLRNKIICGCYGKVPH